MEEKRKSMEAPEAVQFFFFGTLFGLAISLALYSWNLPEATNNKFQYECFADNAEQIKTANDFCEKELGESCFYRAYRNICKKP